MNRLTDDEAVDRFACAMKQKLAQAREKGRSGWQQIDPRELSAMLYHHVEKGDPRDVANFCMFIWHHGVGIHPCQNKAEVVGHVYTMEALVPGSDTRCHVQLYKPLPLGTNLYTTPQPERTAELEHELNRWRTMGKDWLNRTDWVQKRKDWPYWPFIALGMHRADVMKKHIEGLEDQVERLLGLLQRAEVAIDWNLGRSAFTQNTKGKGYQHGQTVRQNLLDVHDEIRAALASAKGDA